MSAEHVNYPHNDGYLYDCRACEYGPCQCVGNASLAPCVSVFCARPADDDGNAYTDVDGNGLDGVDVPDDAADTVLVVVAGATYRVPFATAELVESIALDDDGARDVDDTVTVVVVGDEFDVLPATADLIVERITR